MSWDRNAERSAQYQKRKKSKAKSRTKSHKKEQVKAREDFDDIKYYIENRKTGVSRDTD